MDKNVEPQSTLDLEGEQKVDQLSNLLLVSIRTITLENNVYKAILESSQSKKSCKKIEVEVYNKIQEVVRLAYTLGKAKETS